jgi:hypothetical protein
MHFIKFVEIKVRSLDNFYLSDLNVLDWINRTDLLGNLLLNDLTGEKVKDLSGISLSNFFGNDLVDFPSYYFLLRAKSIVSLALLIG